MWTVIGIVVTCTLAWLLFGFEQWLYERRLPRGFKPYEINVSLFRSGEHRYLVIYTDANRTEAANTFRRWGRDQELLLTEREGDAVAKSILEHAPVEELPASTNY